MKTLNIDDLYFGYKQFDPNTGELRTHNLFGSIRVLISVALYRTKGDKLQLDDPFSFIFCDTRGRCQYEFVISPWAGDGEEQKVDIFSMYVDPNKKYLMSLVDQVSISSCKKFLAEERRRRKRTVL